MTHSTRYAWDSANELIGTAAGAGGGSYTVVNRVAGATLVSSDLGKLHIITSGSNLAFNLPVATTALIGTRVGFEKRGAGTIDINANTDNPDTIAGESDIENTTADTNAQIWLYIDAVNSWNIDGAGRGLWL